MGYADTSDVNKLLGPHQVTAATKVTLTHLTAMLVDVSAELDASLTSIGVALIPPTDAPFLAYLKALASWGGAAQALKSLFPEGTGSGETAAHAYWEKKYQDALTRLRDADDISGLLLAEAGLVSSYFMAYPDEEPIAGESIGLLAGAPLFAVDNLDERPW